MPLPRLRSVSRDLVVAGIGGCLVAVLSTGAAVAVSTTAVSITNPTTGKRAHVTGQESLVTSARDPLTGAYARIDKYGRELVSNVPGRPWNTLSGVQISEANSGESIVRIVQPEKIAFTSMTFTPTSGTGTIRAQVTAYVGPVNGNCDTLSGFAAGERFPVLVQTSQPLHLTWPTPLIWSSFSNAAGGTLCVFVHATSGPSGWALDVAANGFRF